MLAAAIREVPLSEDRRLEALARYDILDTPPEHSFDRVTRLVRRIFDVSMSTVSFIDTHRQWFKSRQGISDEQTSRDPALCNHVIETSSALVIPDTLRDERFATNPFVTGKPFIRFYAGVPLQSPDGFVIGTLCAMDREPRAFSDEDLATINDLAGIVMSELELRRQATTDALTGALSRRAFRDEANRAIALAQRQGDTCGCVLLDLDDFKLVNDRYGHAMGDRVLVQSAAACRAALRKYDLFGRIGGEEFAVLLPQTGQAATMVVAEKLRAAIAALSFATPDGPLELTVSCGIAHADRTVGDLDELLRRADVALYTAKAAGRDRCIEWRPEKIVTPSHRRRVLKAGKIVFNGGTSTIDCTVRSLSDTGAGLDVMSTVGVPKTFKLRIDSEGMSRMCQVVRTDNRSIEVQFS